MGKSFPCFCSVKSLDENRNENMHFCLGFHISYKASSAELFVYFLSSECRWQTARQESKWCGNETYAIMIEQKRGCGSLFTVLRACQVEALAINSGFYRRQNRGNGHDVGEK